MRQPDISLKEVMTAMQDMQAAYSIGKESRYMRRLTGVNFQGSGADYHFRSEAEFLKAIERARDFDRENMVVGQGITRLVNNVIQDGFALDPRTNDKEADDLLWELWNEWSYTPELCHARGLEDFTGLTKLALRHTIVDGDILNLPLEEGSLFPVEGHLLRTPKDVRNPAVHGVEVDPRFGRPLRYWVLKEEKGINRTYAHRNFRSFPAYDEDGARQAFHLFNGKRVSQTRGVTALAPIVYTAGIHDDLQFAKLVQAQVVSCFAIFRRLDPSLSAIAPVPQRGERTEEALGDGSTRTVEGIAPGMEVRGRPGEILEGFSPNVPNPEFFPHAMMLLSFIAVNLDMPVHCLLLDPTKTNFSGWRGALDEARKGWREMQRWMACKHYSPVYAWKLRQWIVKVKAVGKLFQKLGPKLFAHRWNPPGWRYIEPLKDAQAETTRLDNNLTSPRRLHAEYGGNWEELVPELIEDRAMLIEAAIARADQITQRFPDAGVTWRDLAGRIAGVGAENAPAEESDETDETPPERDRNAPPPRQPPMYAESEGP